MKDNIALKTLFEEDQDQRNSIREKLKDTDHAMECLKVFDADVKRAIAVKYFLTTGKLNTADDFFRAAIILLHNEVCVDELALSIVLAQLAKDKGHPKGEWVENIATKRFMNVCFQTG